jgi:NitT/TauT family transport system ATP-binding protein
MAKITVRAASKQFSSPGGRKLDVLTDVNLDVNAGEFLCLLGPSGCGKTTLMNLMAGFEQATAGVVAIDGIPVTKPDPKHITIFQDYALFPWRTVLGNVLFGLEAKGLAPAAAQAKAWEYIELVGLTAFAANFPHQLSGGMKQRVSIARALATEPDILFMDEPFAALDAFTRQRLQDEIQRIWLNKKTTIVFVTHDIDEAVYLGGRIAIMSAHPGCVTKVLDNNLPKPCNRTGDQFVELRRQVYREFEFVHESSLNEEVD